MVTKWRKHKSLAEKIVTNISSDEITNKINITLNKVQEIKIEQAKLVQEYEAHAVSLAEKQKLLEALVHAQHLAKTKQVATGEQVTSATTTHNTNN